MTISAAEAIEIETDILYEDGFSRVIVHLLWILDTLSGRELTISRSQQT